MSDVHALTRQMIRQAHTSPKVVRSGSQVSNDWAGVYTHIERLPDNGVLRSTRVGARDICTQTHPDGYWQFADNDGASMHVVNPHGSFRYLGTGEVNVLARRRTAGGDDVSVHGPGLDYVHRKVRNNSVTELNGQRTYTIKGTTYPPVPYGHAAVPAAEAHRFLFGF